MHAKECTCGNPEMGFNCVCDHVANNPGDIEYSCEWCGLYTASVPSCNKCEADEVPTCNETYDLFSIIKRDDELCLVVSSPGSKITDTLTELVISLKNYPELSTGHNHLFSSVNHVAKHLSNREVTNLLNDYIEWDNKVKQAHTYDHLISMIRLQSEKINSLSACMCLRSLINTNVNYEPGSTSATIIELRFMFPFIVSTINRLFEFSQNKFNFIKASYILNDLFNGHNKPIRLKAKTLIIDIIKESLNDHSMRELKKPFNTIPLLAEALFCELSVRQFMTWDTGWFMFDGNLATNEFLHTIREVFFKSSHLCNWAK